MLINFCGSFDLQNFLNGWQLHNGWVPRVFPAFIERAVTLWLTGVVVDRSDIYPGRCGRARMLIHWTTLSKCFYLCVKFSRLEIILTVKFSQSTVTIKYICMIDKLSYRTKPGGTQALKRAPVCKLTWRLFRVFASKRGLGLRCVSSPRHVSQTVEAFSKVREKPSLFREVTREPIHFPVTFTSVFLSANTHSISS